MTGKVHKQTRWELSGDTWLVMDHPESYHIVTLGREGEPVHRFDFSSEELVSLTLVMPDALKEGLQEVSNG